MLSKLSKTVKTVNNGQEDLSAQSYHALPKGREETLRRGLTGYLMEKWRRWGEGSPPVVYRLPTYHPIHLPTTPSRVHPAAHHCYTECSRVHTVY